MQTLPTNTNGGVSYSFSLWGGSNVYAGSDLYLQVKNVLVAGTPGDNLTIIYAGTKDGNHDGVVKDSQNNVVSSIPVHFECINYDPTGDHSYDQVTGSPYNFCWGRNNYNSDSAVRLRTSLDTPPGAYTVTVTLSPDGQLAHAASYTYAFNVLPPAGFTATPPNSFPPIPNLSTWETEMTALGGYWCDGKNSNSRDSLNAAGNAVDALATQDGFAPYTGYVDPYWVRETAYQIDVWMASEMMGHARYPQLAVAVDKLIGQMDQFTNQQPAPLMYPFMAGIGLEALINWYEMNLLEGTADNRIPLVVKGVLDKLWAQNWLPNGYSLLYNPYNIPNLDNFTELNDLVAPAFAWYWSKTGDDTYLERGDLLFAHTFDTPGSYDWSGKQFSQIYKWSFDYANWRSGISNSTVMQANNPYGGAYADTEPPIETNITVQNITSNSVTITWTTYEPADSEIYYGLTSSYTNSSRFTDKGHNRKTSHLVAMLKLKSNTTYHYQVRSRDAAGNLAASSDYTVTTK
jgi:hypothetical protein